MTPVLCISKSDMPQMMYDLGKNSLDSIAIVFTLLFLLFAILMITIIIITYIKQNKINGFYVSVLILDMISGSIFAETALNTKNKYKFNNFTYNQPAKFVLQYYTVTTSKQYKFIAETEHNVFIKEEK